MVRKLGFVAVIVIGESLLAAMVPVINEDAKLTASDAAADDRFGHSVALLGDTSLVGAFKDDQSTGAAYVFVRNRTSWSEQVKLTASDAEAVDFFGSSVALSEDTAVVGAFHDDQDAGSTYVFVYNGTSWIEQTRLTASDAATGDRFGWSAALSGDTALVGAGGDNHAGGQSAGSAYVFVRNGTGWTEQAKLTASDAADGDLFGESVALSGDTAVVGAYSDTHAGVPIAGSAYVFVRNGTSWTEQAKLTSSDASFGAQFGWSVALSGDTALVGAHHDDHGVNPFTGSAYVFVRNATRWTEQAKLNASDAAFGDSFGSSVALSGDTALVGASRDSHADRENAGSAYVFVRNGTSWTEQVKLIASDAAGGRPFGDDLGSSVTLSGDTALVGARRENAGSVDAGSAYVFGTVPGDDVPATSDWGLVTAVLLLVTVSTAVLLLSRRSSPPRRNAAGSRHP